MGRLTFMRAEALLGAGDFMRADEAVLAAQNADKNLTQKVGQRHFYFIRGEIYDGQGRILDAQQTYTRAVGLPLTGQMNADERHDLIYSYYNLAADAWDTRAYDQGMDHINKFLEMAGDNGNGYFMQGKMKAGLKDDDNAIKDLTASIAAHPDSEKSYMNRGVAYISASDGHPEYVRLGLADFDKAQSLNSDDIELYLYRGGFHLYFATKNPRERNSEAALAAADYQNMIKLAPSVSGGVLYQELAKTKLEQISKLLGQPTKPAR
jgi:tetratricopeptide (TPR) repeat protein